MRRLFWLALGATAGVLIVRKLSRAAERLTPQGVAQSFSAGLNELAVALRDFAADVREAMAGQEAALRSAAGLDSGAAPHPGEAADSGAAADVGAAADSGVGPGLASHRAESG